MRDVLLDTIFSVFDGNGRLDLITTESNPERFDTQSSLVLEKKDLMRSCITGSDSSRTVTAMELILRANEAGETCAVIDLRGSFAPLIDYIPSLRIYRVGKHAAVNPLLPTEVKEEFAKAIAAAIRELYELSRDEMVYFEKALIAAYSMGIEQPTAEDLRDRLLEIESNSQPKESFKIESLRNVLWEMSTGPMGGILACRKKFQPKFPAIFDISPIGSAKGRILIAYYLILKLAEWEPTTVVIDQADWVLGNRKQYEYAAIMEESLGRLTEKGTCLQFISSNQCSLPIWLSNRFTSRIFCNPLGEKELALIEKTYLLEYEQKKRIRHLRNGSALLCIPEYDAPRLLCLRHSVFRKVPDVEISEHMAVQGELEEMPKAESRNATLLEKIFTDRGSMVYAIELLKLVNGGRVPVDAATKHKDKVVRRVVKNLKRYFLIVEYTDNGGSCWYRLTKAGERALAEIDFENDDDDDDDDTIEKKEETS
ncbi:MAG: hypothetical protein LUP94_00535 [Candidatus Methanomethylicus sp.]|nr:hypothetical protein [Candidatus Methanomethylicus sp.]